MNPVTLSCWIYRQILVSSRHNRVGDLVGWLKLVYRQHDSALSYILEYVSI